MDILWILDADDNMLKSSVRQTSKTMLNVELQVGRLFVQNAYLPSDNQSVAECSKLASSLFEICIFDIKETTIYETIKKAKG